MTTTPRIHEGRVAIVTGGASGIGRATAKLLASEGARVCVADIDPEQAEAVVKEIAEAGGDAFASRVDVSVPEENDAMVRATLDRYGALHLAYLNAGVAKLSRLRLSRSLAILVTACDCRRALSSPYPSDSNHTSLNRDRPAKQL